VLAVSSYDENNETILPVRLDFPFIELLASLTPPLSLRGQDNKVVDEEIKFFARSSAIRMSFRGLALIPEIAIVSCSNDGLARHV